MKGLICKMYNCPSRFLVNRLMLASTIALTITTGLIAQPVFAFAGIPGNGACTNFIDNPQDFVRHRQGDITYRISNNFKARYPDSFSQYLVRDVAELWEMYMGGVTPWNADIVARFSYYRRDPAENVYELKSVLSHEFGHAVGMQHSDACYYNTNTDTGQPYDLNFRTSGGVFSIEPTIGPEIMNEVPVSSSPGVKAEGAIDGYFRTPGLDVLEFTGTANPFQSVRFEEISSGMPVILFDSTDLAPSGGQASIVERTNISPVDSTQGQFFDQVNIWVGNNIGIKNRSESWMVENFTGFDITQITLRVDGTSTRRAISENAPAFFTHFGSGLTSSPEQLIFSWSTPPGGPWPPTASGWLSLNLDVHDWSVSEALIWHYSNDAFPMALAYYAAQTPWGFSSPNMLPPDLAPQYVVAPSLPYELTPVPDNIELIPPKSDSDPDIVRNFTVNLPQPDNVRIQRFELLPVDQTEAEILFRMSSVQRNTALMRMFEEQKVKVRNLLGDHVVPRQGISPVDAGFRVTDRAHDFAGHKDNSRQHGKALSWRIKVDLPETQTYAVRLVAANRYSRVTSLSMPEHTMYPGTQLARCDIAGSSAYCCPTEIRNRIDSESFRTHRARSAGQSSCIIGSAGADTLDVDDKVPHFLLMGDGNDDVRVSRSGSLVLLGRGDDRFKAGRNTVTNVRAGSGNDIVHASDVDDHIDAGEGDDRIYAYAGDDVIISGAGNDHVEAGAGNDTVYPGSGKNYIDTGEGDDVVVYTHDCELQHGATRLVGGKGFDRLVLPTTEKAARRAGLQYHGFEQVTENSGRASVFADCEQ